MANLAIMPRLSLNEETCLLVEWCVKEGDKVKVGDKLFRIETDKSTMEVESDFEGTVLKLYYGEYSVVKVLTPVCAIGEEGEAAPEIDMGDASASAADTEEKKNAVPAATAASGQSVPAGIAGASFASPRTKALAEKSGIASFQGISASGAEGRIIEEDIIRFIAGGGKTVKSSEGKIVRHTRIRSVIAKNMLSSLQGSAQLTLHTVFDATAVKNARERFKQSPDTKGITIGDIIVYATVKTLEEYPSINAWVGEDELTEFEAVHLGIATDTDRGLMVPVIFDASGKTLAEISAETKRLAAECREGKLPPAKMQGGTFTVTNLGAMGIREFTPIINPPQACILGVGAIDYAMKKSGEGIVIYPCGHLSLTIDHRAVDGAPGARFLKKLCENLQHIDDLL